MNLHQEFVKLGNDRRKLSNELLALLPEIYEKEIYKKYAATIVEYAGKFGGLSKGVVLKRLRLEKYLWDKPSLKEAIKTEGVHKIDLVAKLATPATENIWLDKVQNMSKAALQELSKEVRAKEGEGEDVNRQNLFGEVVAENLCKAVPVKITLELDEEMTGMFLKLKQKFGGNLSNKEVIKKILEVTEAAAAKRARQGQVNLENKVQFAKTIPGDTSRITRYIPVKIKQEIIANSRGLCTYPNCNRAAEVFHHRERFATNKSHESVIHLCKIHHEFMHNGLVGNEENENWSLQLGERGLQKTDQLYREYRLV